MPSFALVACALTLLVSQAAAAGGGSQPTGPTQSTTYAQLAPARGQWNITVDVSSSTGAAFVPAPTCNDTSTSAPCLQPLLSPDDGAAVQATFSLKNGSLRPVDGLQPQGLIFRACYSADSTKDRPWRKSNAIVDKDSSCPWVMGTAQFSAGQPTYTATWKLPSNATLATIYPAVYVTCQNGSQVSICQTDSLVNVTYLGTTVMQQTPPKMVIACAVCSAVGPLVLAAFFIQDWLALRRSK